MENIGDYIRLRRLQKGFSQDYLGLLLNISQQEYSRKERHPEDCCLKTILIIAKLLDINLSDLQ